MGISTGGRLNQGLGEVGREKQALAILARDILEPKLHKANPVSDETCTPMPAKHYAYIYTVYIYIPLSVLYAYTHPEGISQNETSS